MQQNVNNFKSATVALVNNMKSILDAIRFLCTASLSRLHIFITSAVAVPVMQQVIEMLVDLTQTNTHRFLEL